MTLKLTDSSPKIWGETLPFWFTVLARVACFFLMLTGIFYWMDLLGMMGESGLERGPWKEAALRVLLACSFLIACVGVWQMAFWGVVLWVVSAVTQTAAVLFNETFMLQQQVIIILHMIALIGLIASTGWVFYQARRKDNQINQDHPDL